MPDQLRQVDHVRYEQWADGWTVALVLIGRYADGHEAQAVALREARHRAIRCESAGGRVVYEPRMAHDLSSERGSAHA